MGLVPKQLFNETYFGNELVRSVLFKLDVRQAARANGELADSVLVGLKLVIVLDRYLVSQILKNDALLRSHHWLI